MLTSLTNLTSDRGNSCNKKYYNTAGAHCKLWICIGLKFWIYYCVLPEGAVVVVKWGIKCCVPWHSHFVLEGHHKHSNTTHKTL